MAEAEDQLKRYEECKARECETLHEMIRFNNEQARSFLAVKIAAVGISFALLIAASHNMLSLGRLLERQDMMGNEITVIKQELKEAVLLKLPPNMSVAPPSGITGSIPKEAVQ